MFNRPVFFAVNDESDCKYIENPFKRNLLLLHLLVNGESGLCPDFQLILYTFVRELLLQRLDELCHELLSVSFSAFELVCYGSVLLRICISEIDVFEFALDVVKTELMCQRNIKHHCLKDLSFPGCLWKHFQRSHDFQSVCYLQDSHSGIL